MARPPRRAMVTLIPKPEPSSPTPEPRDYQSKLQEELSHFQDIDNVHELPPIFYYWVHSNLSPIFTEAGFVDIFAGDGPINLDDFFVKYMREAAAATGQEPARFVSIGAGNCDTEIRLAQELMGSGLSDFRIECVDVNGAMLARGRELARAAGLQEKLEYRQLDLNVWEPDGKYCGIIANQSLHHVVELEHLFDAVKRALPPAGRFIVSDIIGRNGHQRWPEALRVVHAFWRDLPTAYRYNRLLKSSEELYQNWDSSAEGFEGVRAQDILRLLIERFHFHLFVAFGNAIDVFVDRAFGHNFDPGREWDRGFIDRVHQCDEQGFANGTLTPTHLVAVLQLEPCDHPIMARGLVPQACVRRPDT